MPEIYRERAKRWRDEALNMPAGKRREVHMALAQGYDLYEDNLEADLLEKEMVAASDRLGG
jgi:hypothetical protein